ncbi:MAG: hypothetical protein JW750_02335 [Anaerolineaceae bacterium]|nr:hypothetical protein [Anaerolineaceae bacterium]
MKDFDGCQLSSLPKTAEDEFTDFEEQSLILRFKRRYAKLWNNTVKQLLKKWYRKLSKRKKPAPQSAQQPEPRQPVEHLADGDWVRVRPAEEIRATLDPFNELKGCAFLENMWQYCGTTQQVFKAMTRFLDERDYKVKKVRGIVLLKGLHCDGTPVFGRCDRACFLFWREEWLEKVAPPEGQG